MSKILKFLGSYLLGVVLLVLLIILTIAGTLEQKYIGLYQAQQKYFYSLIFPFRIGPLTLFFPGAYSLFTLLFINMLVAFFCNFKWNLKKFGILLSHIGVVMLIFGSFLSFHNSKEGQLSFAKGDQENSFDVYHKYELVVEDHSHADYISVVAFATRLLKEKAVLKRPTFPFFIHIKKYYENCIIVKNKGESELRAMPKLGEKNKPGCEFELIDDGTVLGKHTLLAHYSTKFQHKGKVYQISLKRERVSIPFSVKLLHFKKVVYPGTQMAKHYESKVAVIDASHYQETLIKMNHPLRYRGYTFYQSSYFQDKGKTYSVLAVVQNPARNWPYISCLLIFFGMTIHFLQKWFRFLQTQSKKGEAQ